MFNTLCYYLNFISPRIPAALRRMAYDLLPTRGWAYDSPKAGYSGGVDTFLGTVAFVTDDGALTFVW